MQKDDKAGVAQLVELQPSKLNVASSSLVSRSIFFWNPLAAVQSELKILE